MMTEIQEQQSDSKATAKRQEQLRGVGRMTLEIVYHRDDGSSEVVHSRDVASWSALELQHQVRRLQQQAIECGYHCPYTWRIIDIDSGQG
jgi:hypothetical protein